MPEASGGAWWGVHTFGAHLARMLLNVLHPQVLRIHGFRNTSAVKPSPPPTSLFSSTQTCVGEGALPHLHTCSTRSVSSTDRPKPRLLMVACCTTPCLSMMKSPRSDTPSAVSTPYDSAIKRRRSLTSGNAISPRPPDCGGSGKGVCACVGGEIDTLLRCVSFAYHMQSHKKIVWTCTEKRASL
eukprot:350098-Chlamydomonas_euryale.AAC.1